MQQACQPAPVTLPAPTGRCNQSSSRSSGCKGAQSRSPVWRAQVSMACALGRIGLPPASASTRPRVTSAPHQHDDRRVVDPGQQHNDRARRSVGSADLAVIDVQPDQAFAGDEEDGGQQQSSESTLYMAQNTNTNPAADTTSSMINNTNVPPGTSSSTTPLGENEITSRNAMPASSASACARLRAMRRPEHAAGCGRPRRD